MNEYFLKEGLSIRSVFDFEESPKKRNSGKPVFPGTKIIETGFTSEKYVFPFETLRVIFHEESPVFSQPLNVPVT